MNKAFEFALKHYGLEEIKGSKHEPIIIEAFKLVGFSWIDNDETAWCAAIMGLLLHKGGYDFLKTVRARDYEKYGIETKIPKVGDICVFWRVSKSSNYGHVAFYVNEDDRYIYCLGGNQSNKLQISKYRKDRLLSYRRFYAAPIKDEQDDPMAGEVNRLSVEVKRLEDHIKYMEGNNIKNVNTLSSIRKLLNK